MYGNRPLYATQADARLFVWTDEARLIQEALEREQHVLVIGERGAGKTSVLHMVEGALRENSPHAPACYVSLAHTDDVGEAVGATVRGAYEQELLDE